MIKKIKFIFNLLIQLLKRHWFLLILSITIGAISFIAINQLMHLVSVIVPKTERVGVVGRYTLSSLPPRISRLISYGLTEILPNGQATSSPILSSWTVKSEGKEYLFFLKPNTRWQDGKLLEPGQIDYNIKGAEITPIENGVKISLESSFAPLLSLLNRPIFRNNQTGLGPYKIEKIKLEAGNFSTLQLVTTEGTKEKIIFRFYPNESDLITGFNLGEVDEIWGVSNIEEFSSWENISIKTESVISQEYVALFFNTRKEPFSSKRIRQSLAYATEKTSINERALNPISPSSWAYNEKVKAYNFNPDHAKNILDKEDWQPNENSKIKFYVLPELLEWAEKIKEGWQENLNVSSEIHVSSFVPSRDEFDVFLGFGIIPPDPDQYFFWHSTQQGNITGINTPKIDQLLEKGRRTIDMKER